MSYFRLESDPMRLTGPVDQARLTVDPGRAKGLLMFRLAESLIDVIVHGKVARAIAAGQFHAVALTAVTPE